MSHPEPALPPPNIPPPPLTVVLVDDDVALRTALSFSLDLDGFRVESCGSGEALLLRDLPRDNACLVLDYNLPGISGLEALVQLRARHVDLPALLMTSNPRPTVRDAAAAAGVTIVEKPLLGEALVGAIRKAAGLRGPTI